MSLPPLAGEATRQPPRGVKVTPLLLDPFLQQKLWDFEKPTLIFQSTRMDWRLVLQRIKGTDFQGMRNWTYGMVSGPCETQEPWRREKPLQTVPSFPISCHHSLINKNEGKTSGRTHQMRLIINRAEETPKQFSDLEHHIITHGKQEHLDMC